MAAGAHTWLERGLDGGGDELRSLRIDGDVPAEQHAADDVPGAPGTSSCGPMAMSALLLVEDGASGS